ncbi:MAG: ATP-dependent helicase, partial [Candidatus Latescibacterota bacterium]
VLLLYREFRAALSARDLTTHPGISWAAARLCREVRPDHPAANAALILVEDFQDIDPGQFELLSLVAPPGGPVAINVFGDPMGSVFGHRGTQDRFLLDEFPKRYGAETVHLNARCRDVTAEGPAMGALLRETLGRGSDLHLPLVRNGSDTLPPVEIHGDARVEGTFSLEIVGDELDEAYSIGARIEHLLVSGQCQPNDIAVITNEKSRYAHILRSAFRQHGIPLETGTAAAGVLDDFAYLLLRVLDNPDDDVVIRSIVSSPLYRHLQKEVLGGGSTRSRNDGDGGDHGMLREYATGLVADLRARGAPEWMALLVERCLYPVCISYHSESNDDSIFAGITRLLDLWSRYADAIEKLGKDPDIGTFVGLSGFSSSQPAAPQQLPGCVGLYSCRESKGLYFPVVFIVGCSDLLFPSVSDRQSLIPVGKLESLLAENFPERRISIYPARATARVLREQHHFLYISLSRATHALHVTAPRTFGGNEYPAPSAVLEKTVASEHVRSTHQKDRLPPQIRFAKAWTGGGYNTALVESLTHMSPAAAVWHEPRAKATPVGVDRFPLSKSSLEMFLACPRQFFYRKFLRIPQDPTAPARLGTLFHEVMARLGRRFKSKATLQSGAKPGVIRRMIDDVLKEDGSVEPSSFFDQSVRHYLEQMIGDILGLDASLDDEYKIDGVEESIRFSHRDSEFTGKVDRIEDHGAGTMFVVDFKTGEIHKTAKTHRKYVLKALEDPKEADWQIPFYLRAMSTRERRFPDAFRFMAVKAGEKPLAITLYTSPDDNSIPDAAKKSKHNSHLLECEIEQIMDRAVTIAEDIFTPKPHFERTDEVKPCQWCEFAELCQREKKWG